jgi:hypothetical protein
MQVSLIDENGFFIKPDIVEESSALTKNQVQILCPNGFYKPKWNGEQWIEGLTNEEIDAIKASVPAQPTPEELQQQLSEIQAQIQLLSNQN